MGWSCPDPEARLEQAIDRFHAGEVSAAEKALRELLEVGYRCGEVVLYLGHCALASERMADALLLYREARRLQPDRADACLGLAIIAARRLHFTRAIRLLRRATRLDPDLQEGYDNLILCHAALGDHEAAERAYRRSVALDPDSPHPHYNAGFVHFDRGQADRARACWLKTLELAPGYPDAERLVASCDRALGNLTAARRRLDALLKREPRNVDALSDLGLVHEERDEWQSAVHAYVRLLEIDPSHARVRARLGALHYRHGNVDEGLRHLRRAAGEDTTDPDIAEPLAYALLETGDPEGALRVVRAPVLARPDEPEPRLARARVLEMAGRHARAAAEYARACRREGHVVGHRCALAQALFRAGASTRAEAVLEAALAQAQEPGPYRLLVRIALARGDPGAAAVLLGRALDRFPDDPELLVGDAECRLCLGDPVRAIAAARKARRHEQARADSLDVLGRAHLALGDHGRAMEISGSLLSRFPEDPRGLLLRGRASLLAGNADAAARDLERYVRQRPGDPAGYRDLARALQALGHGERAEAQERIGSYVALAGRGETP
jgi:tetratricopeptide (TPR) repeat protein